MTPTISYGAPLTTHAAADHRRIAREQPLPAAMTEHDHRPAGEPLVVFRRQRAPERGLDAEHLEEVAR